MVTRIENSGFDPAAPLAGSRAEAALIFSLAFISGFSIMAIELLAGRMLKPFFGGGIYVWGSVITVFMLSLSIGYLVGGWLSLRNPSLRRFGLIFIAVALTITPLYLFGDPMMEAVFDRIEDPRYGSLVASVVLFFVPTVVLGLISPYAVRLLVSHQHHSGQMAGQLYFVSTLGSAAGTLMTAFYFVLWFEMQQVVMAVGFVMLACGFSAIVAGSRK